MKLKEDKPRIMIDDDFIQIKIWLDAYKAEHDNIWGHTRGSMSFACWFLTQKFSKNKVNIKSIMESEVFVMSDHTQ